MDFNKLEIPNCI